MIGVLLSCSIWVPIKVTASEEHYKGIDVSNWQGNINFQEVKEDGIQIVYIKAGEGFQEKDPYFEQNYQNATEANLEIGCYFYVTATNVQEAQRQANYFVELLKDKTYQCRPAMDFEVFTGLSKSQMNEIAETFMETLENAIEITPVLYSDRYYVDSLWSQTLTKYPLWIAEYDGENEPKNTGKWSEWTGFQYADSGKVKGISGNVDRDYFKAEIFCNNIIQTSEEIGRAHV